MAGKWYKVMKNLFGIMLALFLCGCAEKAPVPQEKEPGIAEYMTGAEQLKTYKETESKIEDINRKLEDRYEY